MQSSRSWVALFVVIVGLAAIGIFGTKPDCHPQRSRRQLAAPYKVDTDAITTKVMQDFAAKEKAKKAARPAGKNATKAA